MTPAVAFVFLWIALPLAVAMFARHWLIAMGDLMWMLVLRRTLVIVTLLGVAAAAFLLSVACNPRSGFWAVRLLFVILITPAPARILVDLLAFTQASKDARDWLDAGASNGALYRFGRVWAASLALGSALALDLSYLITPDPGHYGLRLITVVLVAPLVADLLAAHLIKQIDPDRALRPVSGFLFDVTAFAQRETFLETADGRRSSNPWRDEPDSLDLSVNASEGQPDADFLDVETALAGTAPETGVGESEAAPSAPPAKRARKPAAKKAAPTSEA